MNITLLENADLKDKRVLLRLDFDYLFDKNYKGGKPTKFKVASPTLEYLLKAKSRVVIAPSFTVSKKKKKTEEYSTEPYARYICDLYKCNVYMTDQVAGSLPEKLSHDMEPGSILFLENLFGEEVEINAENEFAEKLSKLADIYVNEAFSLSGDRLASNTAILEYYEPANILPGFNFAAEFQNSFTLNSTDKLFAICLNNNSDIPGSLAAAESLIDRVGCIILMGQLSNIYSVIVNKISNHNYPKNQVDKLKKLLKSAEVRDIDIFHVVDYYKMEEESGPVLVRNEIINNTESYIDIGDETGKIFSDAISGSDLVLWLGEFSANKEYDLVFGSAKIIETVKKNGLYVVGAGTENSCIGGKNPLEDGFFKFQSCSYNTFVNSVTGDKLPVIEILEAKFR